MKQIIFIFCVFLLFGCSNPYTKHIKEQTELPQKLESIKKATENFQAESISEDDTEILFWPDKRISDRIDWLLQTAKKRIFINMYLFTRKDVLEKLLQAKQRWVDVRVILEKNVYEMPGINQAAYKSLEASGIQVVWADEHDINFDHAKYYIIDDAWCIATANLTKSSFETNHEFFLFGKNADTLHFLENTFFADFEHKQPTDVLKNATIAPIDARAKIESLLRNAKKSIVFYSESLSDPEILTILQEQSKKNILVQICLAKKAGKAEKTPPLKTFIGTKIAVTQAKGEYVHAKSILIDAKYLVIGSTNFTENSLDKNREIGLIFRDTPFIKTYQSIVKKDCIFWSPLVP